MTFRATHHPVAPAARPIAEADAHDQRRNTIVNRELWATCALSALAERVFAPAGYAVPKNIRVSCSWPTRGGMARKRTVVGQAFDSSCSSDGFFEIFISPRIDEPEEVLPILAHEMVHISVGIEHGHRGPFRECALAIGLKGPMRSTVAGPAFKRSIAPILEALGPYPHGAIFPLSKQIGGPPKTTGKKPQKGRLQKAVCDECGLTLRVAATWIKGRRLTCPDRDCAGRERLLIVS